MALERVALVGLLGLVTVAGGCAAVTKGTTQRLTVNTSPQGAQCVLSRNGAQIGSVSPTPGTIEISKSRHDIDIRCNKAGFPASGGKLTSELEAMTFGNILIGGLVGVAIDAGTGAMNKYQKTITVPLGGQPPVKPAPTKKAPKKPTKPVV